MTFGAGRGRGAALLVPHVCRGRCHMAHSFLLRPATQHVLPPPHPQASGGALCLGNARRGQEIRSQQSHKSYRPLAVMAFRLTRQAWAQMQQRAPLVAPLLAGRGQAGAAGVGGCALPSRACYALPTAAAGAPSVQRIWGPALRHS